ncbi:MAG: BON domain-containing protein [Pseudomonadota bacterium]
MNKPLPRTTLSLVAAAAAAFALTACNRVDDEERTAGQRLDSAVATVEQKADEARQDIRQETAEARASAEATADKLGDKVADATITASVNAELAKDPSLSALRIDVDTAGGRVMLKGTAPDATARDRATQLAMNVKGVVAVDNQLEIRG